MFYNIAEKVKKLDVVIPETRQRYLGVNALKVVEKYSIINKYRKSN